MSESGPMKYISITFGGAVSINSYNHLVATKSSEIPDSLINLINLGLGIGVYSSRTTDSGTAQLRFLVGLGDVTITDDRNAVYISGKVFTGGTLTSPLILAGDPIQNLGAATKQYIDTSIRNALSGIIIAPSTTFDFKLESGTGLIALESGLGDITQE